MNKKVEIYSTPVCHFCQLAKEFFKEKNIEYTEYNVAADPARRTEMIELTEQMGVPVIRIDDNVMVGFNKPTVAHLLGITI